MKAEEHDSKTAVAFLRQYNPTGPWVLTSIIPDGETTTASFMPANSLGAANWIHERQGKENLYFHVNPVRRNMVRKAQKSDIQAMAWLHVDCDPRAGEDFAEERRRILDGFLKASPKPTVVIDSGGGYQAFFKLKPDPRLVTDGEIEKAEALEAYNVQLEKIFGADACHNIDRIMRLPGTINLPTKKKRLKGRKPALTSLVEFNDISYDIDDFTPAVRVQSVAPPGTLGNGRTAVQLSGNHPDMGVEELREYADKHKKTISNHTLATIACGEDPLDPTRYPSRSEALFAVCCALVKADIPDDIIFSVITGSNAIAESVREKRNWESYATRQIQRAKEEAIEPWLRILNEKHAVISDLGGKCRIISEVFDEALMRHTMSVQSFDDFRNRYRHQKVTVGVNDKTGQLLTKPAGSWWIDHQQRRQYETILFSPGREVPGAYNLWRGFACDALPGEKHNGLLAHLLNNICNGNRDYYTYLVCWMARCIQKPEATGEVAVVLRGRRGTGKSFLVKEFGSLFGRHFLQVSDSKHLVGSFNAHLRDTVLLFGDEAFFAGDKKHESVLKTLVTEESIVIEGKGVDAQAAPNYVHLILGSNEDWVVPAGLDERRFFVLQVGDGKKQDHSYFKQIKEDLNAGGRENLLYFLLHLDISQFEVRRVPQTIALREQKILSMSPEMLWLYEKLQEGRWFRNDADWRVHVLKDLLYDDYVREMANQGRHYRLGRAVFGKFFVSCFPEGYPQQKQETIDAPYENEQREVLYMKKRAYIYIVPDLAAMRAHWDANFGGPFDWPMYDSSTVELPSTAF